MDQFTNARITAPEHSVERSDCENQIDTIALMGDVHMHSAGANIELHGLLEVMQDDDNHLRSNECQKDRKFSVEPSEVKYTLSDRFKLLDRIIKRVLCIKTKKRMFRNCPSSRVNTVRVATGCISIVLFVCIVLFLGVELVILRQLRIAAQLQPMETAIMILACLGLIISRICMFCYNSRSALEYPWLSTPNAIRIDFTAMQDHETLHMKHFPTLLVWALIAMFIFDVLDIITPEQVQKGQSPNFIWEMEEGSDLLYAAYTVFFVIAIFVWYIPLNVALIIQCVICYKYNRILQHFKQTYLECANPANWNSQFAVCQYYAKICQAFQEEFNWKLKWCVQIAIVSWTCTLWLDIYTTKGTVRQLFREHRNDETIVFSLLVFLLGDWGRVIITLCLYLYSGCILCEKFEDLQLVIFNKWQQSLVGGTQDLAQCRFYKDIQQYVDTHPVRIELGSLILTKKNCALLIGSLIVSQLMVVLFKELIAK